MPHNGFIYEAQMDMMENSGHCLKSGRPWRGFDFFLHSFIRQYIHSYLGITKNYLSQLIAVYKRCYTFAMQLEILILLIFIRINRKFLIKFLFRMVWLLAFVWSYKKSIKHNTHENSWLDGYSLFYRLSCIFSSPTWCTASASCPSWRASCRVKTTSQASQSCLDDSKPDCSPDTTSSTGFIYTWILG